MRAPVLLHRHQIDDTAWNALIDRSPHSIIYAYTWYLDVISPDWAALCLMGTAHGSETSTPREEINSQSKVASERTNLCRDDLQVPSYTAVMPLPVLKKWGVATLRQPLFCQYLGIFSSGVLSTEVLKLFLRALGSNLSYISDYAFHPSQTSLLRKVLAQNSDFSFVEKSTHWLDLDKPYAEVRTQYKKDRRINLARSIKESWQICESADAEPLLSLFQAHHAPKIKGVKAHAYPLFRKLTKVLLKKERASIRYATLEGEIHAGIMMLESKAMGIYIFNAADALGRRGNARTFLLDQYFRQAAGRLHTFDFESPEVPGIARFYESFGAEQRVYISIKKNRLPFPLRQLQEWRKWLYRALERKR